MNDDLEEAAEIVKWFEREKKQTAIGFNRFVTINFKFSSERSKKLYFKHKAGDEEYSDEQLYILYKQETN